MPPAPRAGISSDRREAYTVRRFPNARMSAIRGNIEDRLAQLDAGRFDMIIMAAAALKRLGLADRISESIPLSDLPTPPGQGTLALIFRADDERFHRMRSLFVKAVIFVGAGTGRTEYCTLAGIRALQRCEVCLHDRLLDRALLDHLPGAAEVVDVGKQCNRHTFDQAAITQMILDYTRQGRRVVRLKGGDPALFSRLAEEVDALEALHLPYHVLPGISSLTAAACGSGILLTRRGVSRGFCALTPRQRGGGIAPVGSKARCQLPVIFFMGAAVAGEVTRQLLDDGISPDTPAACVFSAGSDTETVLRGTVTNIAECVAPRRGEQPGLLIIGDVAGYGFARNLGALAGRRVLLTCSQALQERAAGLVRDFGGIPIQRPLIRLTPTPEGTIEIGNMARFDWLALTSPSAVRVFFELLAKASVDVRRIPRLMVCGAATARELRLRGLIPDAVPPASYGAEGLIAVVAEQLPPGARVLRLRSDKAGPTLAEALRQVAAEVEDCVVYRNERIAYETLPDFDAVFFASASAVESFAAQWGGQALSAKEIIAIGKPTAAALHHVGVDADLIGPEATVESCIQAFACACVRRNLFKEKS
jgi:uroporphyrinogen III methyltransferase/synthase